MDFYFAWFGNKRKEIEEFIHLVDIDKYDTFVEPFGGSLAFSRYIYNNHPNKKFLICDSDTSLTRFCNNFYRNKPKIIENVKNKTVNITKDEFNEYVKLPPPDNLDDFLTQYLFYNKIYGMRKGLYPTNRNPCKFHKFNERTQKTDEFFNNNVYENIDFTEHLDKVKNDKKAFVFLDPPYPIDSECSYYKDNNSLRIWSYLIDFVNTCECSYIMILNSNVFMDIIFKDMIIGKYYKRYETNSKDKEDGKFVKKSATHLIISNLKT